MPFIFTFVAVSLQGKRVTGIHGIGDPPAAATEGLAEVVHIPNGIILRNIYKALPPVTLSLKTTLSGQVLLYLIII